MIWRVRYQLAETVEVASVDSDEFELVDGLIVFRDVGGKVIAAYQQSVVVAVEADPHSSLPELGPLEDYQDVAATRAGRVWVVGVRAAVEEAMRRILR